MISNVWGRSCRTWFVGSGSAIAASWSSGGRMIVVFTLKDSSDSLRNVSCVSSIKD